MTAPQAPAAKATDPFTDFRERSAGGAPHLQVDTVTGKAQFFPRPASLSGPSNPVEWKKSSGEGRLLTWTVVRTPVEGFAVKPPFSVGLVQLDEGPRIFGLLQADQASSFALNARVRVQIGDGPGEPLVTLFCRG